MKITCLADIEEFEKVPYQERWRGDNVYEMLCNSAEKYGDRPALKFQFTSDLEEQPFVVSYSELLGKIHQTANALEASGVSTGGAVAIILPNLPENHYILWGAQARGIAGPINYMLEPVALRDIMIAQEAEAVVVLGPSEDFDIWEKTAQIIDEVPSLKVVYQVNAEEGASQSQTPAGLPILDFNQALAAQESTGLNFDRQIDREEIGAYFHTGGTTGTPKIAQISHRNQVHVAAFKADYSHLDVDSVGICALPLFHVNAVYNTGLNFFAAGGHPVYMTAKGFRTKGLLDNWWKFIEKYRGTMFNTVPTVVSALLDRSFENIDISSLKYVICGAAPISPEVFRQFVEATGANILEGYGLTEGTLSSSSNPVDGEKRLGSIGIRSPYQEMKCVVLDENNAYVRDCEPNEIGVIVIKGPNVFMGYKQTEANKGAFIDDWFITGDLAREDEDGYFWMTGRAKDLIIRSGNNIDPKEIEDTLTDHPAVSLAAAVGQPDSYAGELPCAFVTLGEDVDSQQEGLLEDILDFAKKNISERAATPVHIEILNDMPLTAIGKIFKPSLQMLAIERVLGGALREVLPGATISVEKHDKRGILATVSGFGKEGQETAKQVLDRFTIPYEIV